MIDRPKPWRARYRGADGREHSRTFARKADAERWLRAELARLDRGEWIDPDAGAVAFADYAAGWLRGLVVKPKTLAGYRSLLESRILPALGAVELRRISPAGVRRWIAGMADEGLSASRIAQAKRIITAVLAQAVTDGLIGRNPAAVVKAPPVRPEPQRFLTADQVTQLAEAAEDRQAGAGVLVRFLTYTGLRWDEAVALRRSSLDLVSRRVRVTEAVTEVSGRIVAGTPKSHRQRSVILPRFLTAQLTEHLAANPGDPDTLVFTAPEGGFLRVGNFRRAVWIPAIESAGFDGLRLHDLRHTAASLMISAGASVKAVQTALGHASAQITLDVYAGLYSDDLEALAQALDDRFGDADAAQARHRTLNEVRRLAGQGPRSRAPQGISRI